MILPTFKNILSYSPIQNVSLNKNCWVRSPAWDIFWLHSGVWLGLLIFAFSSQPALEMFYIVGVFLFWISHRFSSFYIAWGTGSYSTVRASQPWRYGIFPAILVLGVFAFLFIPKTVFPVSVPVRILGLLLLDFFGGCIISPHSTMECSGSFNTGRILQLLIYHTSMIVCSAGE